MLADVPGAVVVCRLAALEAMSRTVPSELVSVNPRRRGVKVLFVRDKDQNREKAFVYCSPMQVCVS